MKFKGRLERNLASKKRPRLKVNLCRQAGGCVDSASLLHYPGRALEGLTATEPQMKRTHVIYRQCFLLKNNCGDRDWAQGSMAMDFSVVRSCIVGHNARWKEHGEERMGVRVEERLLFSDGKKRFDQSLDTQERRFHALLSSEGRQEARTKVETRAGSHKILLIKHCYAGIYYLLSMDRKCLQTQRFVV